jgi:hypothetical protein
MAFLRYCTSCSPAASKQKVEEELSSWRSSPELFDVQKFERSLITTKISQLLTYGSILLLQFATVMSLIVQPISEVRVSVLQNPSMPFVRALTILLPAVP